MFLITVFLLFVSINCQDSGLKFFEGFAQGIEAEIGNPKECAKSANITLTDFDNGYLAIKHGVEHLSIDEVKQGLLDWSLGLQQMTEGLKACGAFQLAADIEKLAADIQTGEGIVELIAREVLNIIENDIAGLFHNAVKAWERSDYYNCGVYTGQIVGLLLEDNVTKQAAESFYNPKKVIVKETVRNTLTAEQQREQEHVRRHEERKLKHERLMNSQLRDHEEMLARHVKNHEEKMRKHVDKNERIHKHDKEHSDHMKLREDKLDRKEASKKAHNHKAEHAKHAKHSDARGARDHHRREAHKAQKNKEQTKSH